MEKIVIRLILNLNLDHLDTQKFYNKCPSRSKGTVLERDFEDIILKDIKFKATNKELDILVDYYGK